MFLVAALVVLVASCRGLEAASDRAVPFIAGLLFNISRSGQLAFFISLPVVPRSAFRESRPPRRGRCAAVVLVLAPCAVRSFSKGRSA
jgi:hypothetical protein